MRGLPSPRELPTKTIHPCANPTGIIIRNMPILLMIVYAPTSFVASILAIRAKISSDQVPQIPIDTDSRDSFRRGHKLVTVSYEKRETSGNDSRSPPNLTHKTNVPPLTTNINAVAQVTPE